GEVHELDGLVGRGRAEKSCDVLGLPEGEAAGARGHADRVWSSVFHGAVPPLAAVLAASRGDSSRLCSSRSSASGLPCWGGGLNTPHETMNATAWSTVRLRSMTLLCGTMIVKPPIGMGEVGMRTVTIGSPTSAAQSSMPLPVTNPRVHEPARGYS